MGNGHGQTTKQKPNLISRSGSPHISRNRKLNNVERRASISRHSKSNSIQRSGYIDRPDIIKYKVHESGRTYELSKYKDITYRCELCEIRYEDIIGYSDTKKYRCLDCVQELDIINRDDLDIANKSIFNGDQFTINNIDDYLLCKTCNKHIQKTGVILDLPNASATIYCLMCILIKGKQVIKNIRVKELNERRESRR
jgi:hypothetical protein